MPTPKGPFEKIPVETVKQIAKEFEDNSAAGQSVIPAQSGAAPREENWRELAAAVQRETDPHRIMALVDELIAKLSEKDGSARKRIG